MLRDEPSAHALVFTLASCCYLGKSILSHLQRRHLPGGRTQGPRSRPDPAALFSQSSGNTAVLPTGKPPPPPPLWSRARPCQRQQPHTQHGHMSKLGALTAYGGDIPALGLRGHTESGANREWGDVNICQVPTGEGSVLSRVLAKSLRGRLKQREALGAQEGRCGSKRGEGRGRSSACGGCQPQHDKLPGQNGEAQAHVRTQSCQRGGKHPRKER